MDNSMNLSPHQGMVQMLRAFQLVDSSSTTELEPESDPVSDSDVDQNYQLNQTSTSIPIKTPLNKNSHQLLDHFISSKQEKQDELINHNENENEHENDLNSLKPHDLDQNTMIPISNSINSKLIGNFNLPDHELILGQYPCWLFRSVLLNGHLYLTTGHLCFYAYLKPSHKLDKIDSKPIHVGLLSKRNSSKLVKQRYSKYWFILKDSILSWYPSSHDLYFPSGQLDLHYCTQIDPQSSSSKHPNQFRLVVSNKSYTFASESEQVKEEWIKRLKQVIFTCQHRGEHVKISIPLETIEDVERCQSLQFVETIRIKTKEWVDKHPDHLQTSPHVTNAIPSASTSASTSDDVDSSLPSTSIAVAVPDDYFFAFGQDVQVPLKHIQATLASFRSSGLQSPPAQDPQPHSSQEEQPSYGFPPSLPSSSTIAAVSPNSSRLVHDSTRSLHLSDPLPSSSSKTFGQRIRKLSTTSNKLVGSPIRSSSIKVRNPDNCHRSSITPLEPLVQKFNESCEQTLMGVSGVERTKKRSDPSTSESDNQTIAKEGAPTVEEPKQRSNASTTDRITSRVSEIKSVSEPSLPESSIASQTIANAALQTQPSKSDTTFTSTSEIQPPSASPEASMSQSHTYPPGLPPRQSSSYTRNRYTTSPPKSPAIAADGHWGILPAWLKHVPKPPTKALTSAAKNLSIAAVKTMGPLISSSSPSKALDPETEQAKAHSRVSITVSNNNSVDQGDLHHSLVLVDRPGPEHVDRPALSPLTSTDEKKFLSIFSFGGGSVRKPSTVKLVLKANCYLFRGLPIYGQLYISKPVILKRSNVGRCCVCFKGQKPISKTVTKMILPIIEILELRLKKGFRFGYFGLGMVVKEGEIFLEFGSETHQAVVLEEMTRLVEEIRALEQQEDSGDGSGIGSENEDEEMEGDMSAITTGEFDRTMSSTVNRPEPPIMFQSTSSSFLTFKPAETLHITCLTIGSRGDVQPYIALCVALAKDGHRTRIASHGEYREWIQGYGIEFVEVGGDPAELMKMCVDNGMFTLSFLKEGLTKFRSWLDDLLISAQEACKGTDLLIESPSAMAGIHVAESMGIPYFRAFTMPWTRTRTYPHAFAVPDHKMGGGYNFMTYTVFDQVFWRATSSQVNRWRKERLGLESTSLEKLEPHRVPFLYNFSPTIVPMPLDWFEWVHITGYWFLDEGGISNESGGEGRKVEVEDGLVKFLERGRKEGKKIVYIGFGSIVVQDPVALSKMIVEAVTKTGVYAIVSKGWSDRLQATKEPEDDRVIDEADAVYNVHSVPHDWLFPRIDAVCHHGGAGTTGASLRAGIPTIIRPFFGDQYFWADRVERLGVGIGLRKMTVKNLCKALETATGDEVMIKKAKLMGEQIKAESGVSKAVECIYRDLDYAKSLVKKKQEKVEDDDEGGGEGEGEGESDEPGESDPEEVEDNSSWDLLSQPPQSPFFGPIKN